MTPLHFSRALAVYTQLCSYTQTQAAKQFGCTQGNISKLCAGKFEPDLGFVFKVIDHANTDLKEFCDLAQMYPVFFDETTGKLHRRSK